MNQSKLDHDFFEMMKREHSELIDLMSRVRHALESDIRDPGGINQLIGDLYENIVSHFHHEEEGGYLCEALERAPRLSPHAEKLFEQHETLGELLGELLGLAQQREGTDSWWKNLSESFNNFSRELLQHEAAEDDLVQEAFIQDVGTGD